MSWLNLQLEVLQLSGAAAASASLVLRSTALLVLTLAASVALRRASASARHLVWTAGLLGAVLVLPLVALGPWRFEVLPPLASTWREPVTEAAPREVGTASRPRVDAPSPHDPGRSEMRGEPAHATNGARLPLPALLLLAWLLPATVLLGRLGFGALRLRRLTAEAQPLTDPAWTRLLYESADRLELSHAPRLLASDRAAIPFTCDVLHPAIVVPRGANEWSEARRRAVLVHELAHVRRFDLIGHLAGRIACAIHWFNPLVWLAAARLRAESERACDDLVLTAGAPASEYADHLLQIVAGARLSGAPAVALPMAQRREFEGRMLAILQPGGRRTPPKRAHAAGLVACSAFATVLVGAAVPAPPGQPDPSSAPAAAVASDNASEFDESPRTTAPLLPTEPDPSPGPDASAPDPVPAGAPHVPAPPPLPAATPPDAEAAVVAQAKADRPDAPNVRRQRPHAERSPGDAGGTLDVAELVHALEHDPADGVRRTAAWALARRRASDAQPALTHALLTDSSVNVREMAAWSLGQLRAPTAVSGLAYAFRTDTDAEVRLTAFHALTSFASDAAREITIAALTDRTAPIRIRAAWAIGTHHYSGAVPDLVAALADTDANVRLTAAWALGNTAAGATAAVPALELLLRSDETLATRQAALWALLRIPGNDARRAATAALQDPDDSLRERAVAALSGSPPPWPWPWPWPQPRPFP